MTQAAITFILGTIAVATFMLKGKQWPTFITAALFGLYLGGTSLGQWVQGIVNGLMAQLNAWLS